MNKQHILIGVLSVGLLLALAFGNLLVLDVNKGQAQEPGPESEFSVESYEQAEAEVGSQIPIQGQLTDASGNPVNGTYTIRFRLYDKAAGGSVLCHDINSVEVTKGLFNSEISGCSLSVINGQQLYLGIKVGTDAEMTDRQPIYPAPYAISLKPGAVISGTIAGDAVVDVENTSPTGSALRGYASAASGANSGVRGISYSPDGYGGYFGNVRGGYALGLGGAAKFIFDASASDQINVGDRYRDNAIVAWAKVSSSGNLDDQFGVDSVDRFATGCYKITLDIHAHWAVTLIPMAVAEIDAAPTSAAAIRIVSINQQETSVFTVYVNDGNGNLVNNDIVFMVTAR